MVLSGQEARIREADRFLRTATFLFDNGYYSDCISRTYYAIYPIAVALLAVKANIIRQRWDHDELHKAFLGHFCKRGFLFNMKDGKTFSKLMSKRFDADYHMESFNKTSTERLLTDAEAFVRKVKKELSRNA